MAEEKSKREKPYKINSTFREAIIKIISVPKPKKKKN
jgi:hypothetical protein